MLHMIEEIERTGDAEAYVRQTLDKGERLMGFGHRVYRAEDPRARVLRRTARELAAPRFEVAEALEKAALAELHARRPDRVLATNVEFWAAIVLDFAEVPAHMFTSMFTCARTAGWSAHILEQKRTGRLVRPSARYVGPGTRDPREIEGTGTSPAERKAPKGFTNADDPRVRFLLGRGRPDVPATRGSGDCVGLGRLRVSRTRRSGAEPSTAAGYWPAATSSVRSAYICRTTSFPKYRPL
ncbi:hypothetical protein SHKM778_88480 [Streptomyces sp. KM77-8]|uniref:citrate synthase (unknown stereospecificity) n=1 Tax=Streptomyces haneummycinicus TaxID=3074435 RepID=A0AAT9HZ02_9ACTN